MQLEIRNSSKGLVILEGKKGGIDDFYFIAIFQYVLDLKRL